MTTAHTETRKIIAAAVEPRRAETVARPVEHAKALMRLLIHDLTAAGVDLNKVAPRPTSTMSRMSYRMAKDKRAMYESITRDDNPRETTVNNASYLRYTGKAPDIRAIDNQLVALFIERAAKQADA